MSLILKFKTIMEMDRQVLSRIKEILKANPKGMNITEIVGQAGMNRQSVAKYLEMLVMSGHVDVRTFGPSKVFYLSQRLPVSAMLSLSEGFIIVLDKTLKVINVNDHFLEFAGVKREDIMYKSFDRLAFSIEFEPPILPMIKSALNGSESSIEAFYHKNDTETYYNIRFIPMVMDDGEKSVAIFFEDVTEKKIAELALKASEEKFRVLVNTIASGILILDDMRIVDSNNGAENITGYGKDELSGMQLKDLLYNGHAIESLAREIEEDVRSFKDNASREKKSYEAVLITKGRDTRNIGFSVGVMNYQGEPRSILTFYDITPFKLLMKQLEKSEEKYRVLAETTEDIIFILRPDMTLSYMNSSGARIFDKRPDEFIGIHVSQLFRDNNFTLIEKLFSGILMTGESRVFEMPIDVGGKVIWANTRMTPIKINDEIVSILGISRDITESKQMEEKLRMTQATVDYSSDSVFWVSRDGRIIYANDMASRELGYTKEELMTMSVGDLDPDYTPEGMRRMWDDIKYRGEPFAFEVRHRTKDGRIFPVEIRIKYMNFGDKEFTVTTERNLTERRRMEEMLRMTQLSVDKSTDSIIWHMVDGRITYVNEAACQKLGYTRDEFLSMRVGDIDADFSRATIDRVWTPEQRRIGHAIIEAFHQTKDGRVFPVEVHSNLLKFGDMEFFVAICLDMTERVRREEEILRSKDELEALVSRRTRDLENANRSLVESQRTLTMLISNLPGISYRCRNDQFWTMEFISDRCLDITGYSRDDLTGNGKVSYEDLIHPEDRSLARSEVETAVRLRRPFNMTYRIVTRTGDIRWVNEQGGGVFSPGGELIDIEGYICDISDAIEMKASRDKSEEKYRNLIENISDGIWETDRDLKFKYINHRVHDMIGYTPEEILGSCVYDLMPKEEAGRMKKAMLSYKKDPRPFSMVRCGLKHKYGGTITVEISADPIFNEKNEYQGYRGITRKIDQGN